jgi:hypothetical protein
MTNGESAGLRKALAGLFDDAAMFPPGNASVEDATAGHLALRRSSLRDLLGPLVVAASKLSAVRALWEGGGVGDSPEGAADRALSVVVPIGSDDWRALLDSLPNHSSRCPVVAVEVSLGPDEGAPARAATACDEFLALGEAALANSRVFVEVPGGAEQKAVLDVLAALEFAAVPISAKLRTGGLSAEAFPSEAAVAAFLSGCAERLLTFKCTAGLHSAVRHRAVDTGFEHHGLCNVLLAAGLAVEGSDLDAIEAILREQDEEVVAGRVADGVASIAHGRSLFLSVGTCSVAEPAEDLGRLGLLSIR